MSDNVKMEIAIAADDVDNDRCEQKCDVAFVANNAKTVVLEDIGYC